MKGKKVLEKEIISVKDFLGLAKLSNNALELFKTIYPDLVQPGVKQVGLALETTLGLANTILLPLKLMNSNANVYFNQHMEKYRVKMAEVDENEVVQVPPQISLNILDELLKVTNEDIANLFINLLANASTKSTIKYAHPGFIEVIKNLSADEAKIISEICAKGEPIIYAYIDGHNNGIVPVPLTNQENNITDMIDLDFKENNTFYALNLIKLGILKDERLADKSLIDKYNKIQGRMNDAMEEILNTIEEMKMSGSSIDVQPTFARGRYSITEFGEQFIKSISEIPHNQLQGNEVNN
ncbi:Abi-alpha family protein [Lysinibacillus capsici]|uniref:Abi-alpha family protein n=1 Tax=Lysinibacillus capsici TaxID=2115968 RepID=UPI0015EB6983|nr:Abi-alpha family protein [Lysinibacillus capsici]